MTQHEKPARFAGLRNGDLMKQPSPWGARVVVAMSLVIVLFAATKLFAFTISEVRAMPRHIEGVE